MYTRVSKILLRRLSEKKKNRSELEQSLGRSVLTPL